MMLTWTEAIVKDCSDKGDFWHLLIVPLVFNFMSRTQGGGRVAQIRTICHIDTPKKMMDFLCFRFPNLTHRKGTVSPYFYFVLSMRGEHGIVSTLFYWRTFLTYSVICSPLDISLTSKAIFTRIKQDSPYKKKRFFQLSLTPDPTVLSLGSSIMCLYLRVPLFLKGLYL
jgi:hypothetical protein